jgi:hypothetical protein
VTVTASDATGNTSTCSFTVKVQDTNARAGCPADVTVEATSPRCLVSYPAAAASDSISSVTVTYSKASAPPLPWHHDVTVTAKDASNNTSTCSFTVTVQDTTARRSAARPT